MTAQLFDRHATGGVVARDGFEYQDAFVLENLPLWLSQSGFTQVVSEVLGDVEVRYFRPGGGTWCVLYEAKSYQLSKQAIWEEVDNFIALHDNAPDEYVRFVLVCDRYLGELRAALNKLSRLGGVGQSLNQDSHFRLDAEADIVQTLVGLGASEHSARFVLERVSFQDYSADRARDMFTGAVAKHLPVLGGLGVRQLIQLRDEFQRLIAKSVKGVVNRVDLESAILQALGEADAKTWAAVPTVVKLAGDENGQSVETLRLPTARFSGPGRGALEPEDWAELQASAEALGGFLKSTCKRRTVALDGKQRMSLSCTLGYCFSSTRGFVIVVEHNGQVFRTDNHERAGSQFFEVLSTDGSPEAREGVVAIGFPTAVAADIDAACSALGLASSPRLLLQSQHVIEDMRKLNTAVIEAKSASSDFRSTHKLTRIHLFIKAPSVFAMILGHRLNALGPIQIYDWTGRAYVATAALR